MRAREDGVAIAIRRLRCDGCQLLGEREERDRVRNGCLVLEEREAPSRIRVGKRVTLAGIQANVEAADGQLSQPAPGQAQRGAPAGVDEDGYVLGREGHVLASLGQAVEVLLADAQRPKVLVTGVDVEELAQRPAPAVKLEGRCSESSR